MDSEAVGSRPEERSATQRLGDLKRPDVAAGRAHRLEVPPRDLFHESPEKKRRTPPSPNTDRAQRDSLMKRLRKVERQYRAIQTGLIALLILFGVIALNLFDMGEVGTGKALIKSEELNLVDSSGRPRVSLRMYSETPVMQVLDANGNARLSFGLRFDDSPFIDLSDSSGMTRARFQVTGGGEPALHMFDDRGESTFSIN